MLKSIRLNKIYSYLEKDTITADIGCDHGLLIIEYALNNKALCYGRDNKENPLSQAKKNIEALNNNINVKLELADGLDNLNKNVKQVVIAGMGGENIKAILSKNNTSHIDYFILQPNNDSFILRDYLAKHNCKHKNII